MQDLNETQTRKQLIDKELEKSGWSINDKTKVLLEVNTLQSNFKNKEYKLYGETNDSIVKSKYADYLLLDSKGEPLAIIEAKRTSKDPLIGKAQAEMYYSQIVSQTNKDLFIYFTNGNTIWFYNKPYEAPRVVKGFHTQEDLELKRFQNNNTIPFDQIEINENITNRYYQKEAINSVLKGIKSGKRTFLLVMATGTGKTRTIISLVDVLLRSRKIKRVLFLTDRKTLRDQAYGDKNFGKYFPDYPREIIYTGKINKNSQLYFSTIQTMMENYNYFSPGFFDLIISDESHRSIYNKWKDVLTYFDGIKVGLTATPSEDIERDTFQFFGCDLNPKTNKRVPTYEYSYPKAIKDGYLVDFKVVSSDTNLQVEGIKFNDIPEEDKKRLLSQGYDESELNFEGSQIEKRVLNKGTVEAWIKEFMDKSIKDPSGNEPGKTIIFAITHKHANRMWKMFNELYPKKMAKGFAEIIDSQVERVDPQELIKKFENNDYPRIAISVDMLDTGLDVREIVNLVFAKPVISKIKFWQMIGRGTRKLEPTDIKEWCTTKEEFLIFDFFKNFEHHNLEIDNSIIKSTTPITVTLFKILLEQYSIAQKQNDQETLSIIKNKITTEINNLPKEGVFKKENYEILNIVRNPKFWKYNINHYEYLKNNVTSLMKRRENVNYKVFSFRIICERIILSILKNKIDNLDNFKENISSKLLELRKKTNIYEIKNKEKLIDNYLINLWNNLNINNINDFENSIAPLMKYLDNNENQIIEVNIDDFVAQRKIIEYGPEGEFEEDINIYKPKVEKRIEQLINEYPLNKLKDSTSHNIYFTNNEIINIEKELNKPDLYITESTLQKLYNFPQEDLIEIIKRIVGIKKEKSKKDKIIEKLKTYIAENNYLDKNKIDFLRALENVYLRKGKITYDELKQPPFTNFGINTFSDDEINNILNNIKM